MSDGIVEYQLKKFDCGCEWRVAIKDGEIIGVDYEPEKAPLNCQKVWNLLASGKTKGVFQLETPLGQSTSKKCMPYGVEELSDVISAIRPGTGDALLDGKNLKQRYIDRKNGREEPDPPHPLLREVLEGSQGIFLYQEQAMLASQVIAGFTGEEANKLRKAAGKKLPELMAKIKTEFVERAEKLGKVSKEEAELVFSIIEASQRYSFNKCLTPDTEVKTNHGIKILYDVQVGDQVMTPTGWANVVDKINTGEQVVYRVDLETKSIDCTIHHKFMCEDGKVRPLYEIVDWAYRIQTKNGLESITNIRILAIKPTLDIEIDNESHVYYANGIATSNSHSVAYALNGIYFSAYPKAHFPRAFFLAELEYSKASLKESIMVERGKIIDDARYFGVEVEKPDLRLMNASFLLKGRKIYYGLAKIKGVGDAKFSKLAQALDGKNVADLKWLELMYYLSKTSSDAAKNLICAGAVDFTRVTRSRMVFELGIFKQLSDTQKQFILNIGNLKEGLEELTKLTPAKNTPILTKTGLNKVVKILDQYESPPTTLRETKQKIFNWELELLGSAFTCTEIDDEDLGNCTCEEFIEQKKLDEYKITGIISSVKTYITKGKQPGQEMAFVDFNDGGIKINSVVFPDTWTEYKHRLFEGNKAVFVGSRGKDNSFVIKRVLQI